MISILTVNFYSGRNIHGLTSSIEAHPPREDFELIVANHSQEPIGVPASARRFTRLIQRPNDGYAEGINVAYRESRGDVLFITNPDVRIGPGVLDRGAAGMRERLDLGAVLPRLRYPDGRDQPSIRRFYTWPVALYARSPLRALGFQPASFRHYLYEDIDRSVETDVDWGIGAAMFLRRGDFPDGVLFDPRYFLYFEDVDLCWRLWASGRRVLYRPDIECVHDYHRASAVPFGFHGWHHMLSFLRFIRKYGGLPGRPRSAVRAPSVALGAGRSPGAVSSPPAGFDNPALPRSA